MEVKRSLGSSPSFKLSLGLLLVLLFISLAVGKPGGHRAKMEMEEGESSGGNMRTGKRTFCNAFTGCGKKRSGANAAGAGGGGGGEDYSEGDNSEDNDAEGAGGVVGGGGGALEEVARDILAEARLWEALQARNSLNLNMNRVRGKGGNN